MCHISGIRARLVAYRLIPFRGCFGDVRALGIYAVEARASVLAKTIIPVAASNSRLYTYLKIDSADRPIYVMRTSDKGGKKNGA